MTASALGCGDDDDATPPAGQGGASGQSGGSAGATAAQGGQGPGGGGGGAQPGPGGAGGAGQGGAGGGVALLDAQVTLRLTSNQGNAVTRASAYFSKLAAPAPAQQREAGGCTFTEFSGPVPADPEPPQAGPITVSKAGATLLTLKPSPVSGYYDDPSADEALFAAGDRIGFLAAGASVPAFSGEVIAPGPLVVTSPTKPAVGQPIVIDRSQPFDVTWTPGPAGANVNLLLLASSPTPGHSFAARCSVDQSVGKATFAPEGLAIMPAGEGNVRFSAIQKSVVSAGAASVELLVVAGATGPGGAEGMFELPAKFE